VRDFMVDITKNTIEHRETNGVSRKDFMQLLLQLRNTGKVGEDGDWDAKNTTTGDFKFLKFYFSFIIFQIYFFQFHFPKSSFHS
jgi:hypothetical protein